MFRIILKRQSSWRFISKTANRRNGIEHKILAPKVIQSDNCLSSKAATAFIDKQECGGISATLTEFPPPVHAQPFEEIKMKDELKDVHSDIEEFVDSLEPPLPIAFNLAAYVNQSASLQNLVRLGVDLSEVEKKPEAAKFLLLLDFEKDIKKYIQFLHDHGVHADDLGRLITKNPFIFKESIENLEIRINYLKSKKFQDAAIARIMTRNPYFLSMETKQVDSRLGFFQKQFLLSGDEVRYLTTKNPKLVSYNMNKLREKLFVIKEELGYKSHEMKKLLLMKPKIYMMGSKDLKERFHIVHNLMKISHEEILKFPEVFLKRGFILKQRHLYLEHLGRAQYDPTQPLYVSLFDFATLGDSAFCEKCAKTSVEQYNEFLRTIG